MTGIPIFFTTLLCRGYNQSTLLARQFSEAEGYPFLPLLRKWKWTRHQARLGRVKRLQNINGAFALKSQYRKAIVGKNILLVDDVISTGSTANEAARILKTAGAKRVYGLFLATGA